MGSRKYPEATEHAKTTKVKTGVIDINLFCLLRKKNISSLYTVRKQYNKRLWTYAAVDSYKLVFSISSSELSICDVTLPT